MVNIVAFAAGMEFHLAKDICDREAGDSCCSKNRLKTYLCNGGSRCSLGKDMDQSAGKPLMCVSVQIDRGFRRKFRLCATGNG
jgi:hypothetical protein